MFRSVKFLITLLLFFIVIISTNAYLDNYLKEQNIITEKSDISDKELENIFLNSLKNFDITEQMIAKLSNGNIMKYKVDVFNDIPLDMILLELERNFADKNVNISTKDSIIGKRSVCRIFSNKELKLISEFSIKEKTLRNKGNLVFFIKINKPNEIKNEILDSPEPVTFLIVPNKDFHRMIRTIKEKNKRYYIYLNEEIKDLVYKFGKGYSKLQTKNTLYNILRDFEHSNRIILNTSEDWLNENEINIIKYELKRNNIKVIDDKIMIDLTDSDDKTYDRIKEDISLMNKDDIKTYMINSQQYIELSKHLPSIRKSGYKILNISSNNDSLITQNKTN